MVTHCHIGMNHKISFVRKCFCTRDYSSCENVSVKLEMLVIHVGGNVFNWVFVSLVRKFFRHMAISCWPKPRNVRIGESFRHNYVVTFLF